MVRKGSRVSGALFLILLGAILLAVELVPNLRGLVYGEMGWPLIVVAVGAGLLLVGLVTGAAGMAVPACIVGGIGALLYWQNATGNWESWAYAWTLIPGFAGVGIMLAGLLEWRGKTVWAGAWQVAISAILFCTLGSFLGGPIWLGPYWPALLIVLGLMLLVRAIWRHGPQPGAEMRVTVQSPAPASPAVDTTVAQEE